eukprot:366446-Chlamydomonas_euryale.AAC.6
MSSAFGFGLLIHQPERGLQAFLPARSHKLACMARNCTVPTPSPSKPQMSVLVVVVDTAHAVWTPPKQGAWTPLISQRMVKQGEAEKQEVRE